MTTPTAACQLLEAAEHLSAAFRLLDTAGPSLKGPGPSATLQLRQEIAHAFQCASALAIWGGADRAEIESIR